MKSSVQLLKIQKILSYNLRFIHNCQNRTRQAILLPCELETSPIHLIKFVQYESFSSEILLLKNNKSLSKYLKIPFVDPFVIFSLGE